MRKEPEVKTLNDLTLLDRFLFAEAMDDPLINQLLLEIIFGQEITIVGRTQTEKEFRKAPSVKSIRVDVFSTDEEGNVYDSEVQKKDVGDLPKRSRKYQSMIDAIMLPPGTIDYNQLKNCYIIMIGPFDILKRGSYQYTFQMRCDEYPECSLEDGGFRIFLNTRGSDEDSASPELIELLHYIESVNGYERPRIKGDKLKQLHSRVQTIRESEEIGGKWMQLWEEKLREQMEARAQGKTEGKAEGEKLQIIYQIRKKIMKNIAPEAIADALEDELENILPLYEVIKADPELSDEEVYQIVYAVNPAK
ncbi:MAG: PD-(D/E)XK nuclease family transposase [Lachnospiraceae bacterium]